VTEFLCCASSQPGRTSVAPSSATRAASRGSPQTRLPRARRSRPSDQLGVRALAVALPRCRLITCDAFMADVVSRTGNRRAVPLRALHRPPCRRRAALQAAARAPRLRSVRSDTESASAGTRLRFSRSQAPPSPPARPSARPAHARNPIRAVPSRTRIRRADARAQPSAHWRARASSACRERRALGAGDCPPLSQLVPAPDHILLPCSSALAVPRRPLDTPRSRFECRPH
jgi:hypothetical protein